MSKENDELEYYMKDPCVLWYWNDWAGGTKTMSRFLKGCYMDVLDAQFNSESNTLSLDEIKTVLGGDFGASWPILQKKFKVVEGGMYMNKRLTFEKLRRSKYSKGRKNNLKGTPHMETEIETRKLEFIKKVHEFKIYDEKLQADFIRYWTEHSEKGKKMRFEKQETFEIKGRLVTWKNNNDEWSKNKKHGKSTAAEKHESVTSMGNLAREILADDK